MALRANCFDLALGLEGIEAIVFRTVGDQRSLDESVPPAQLERLPQELGRVDALLGHLAFRPDTSSVPTVTKMVKSPPPTSTPSKTVPRMWRSVWKSDKAFEPRLQGS